MLVQACLNGGRKHGYHPRLPLTPEALAADARACVRAGAAELHLHVRGPDGAESLTPAAVDATVWPFVERCAREGYSTRVGLEDGRDLPDGSPAGSNADLVAAAVALMRAPSR